jgi:hypothetical protein
MFAQVMAADLGFCVVAEVLGWAVDANGLIIFANEKIRCSQSPQSLSDDRASS